MGKNIEKNALELIEVIRKLDGHKIITLVDFVKNDCHKYDVSESGTIGYEKAHELLFKTNLFNAMRHGSVIIRQFTDKIVNDLPVKNIYGVALQNGEWTAISAKEIETAHCTDNRTGRRIPREENVVFASLI